MLILFAFKMVEMSDKNFTKAKLKEHILSVSKYSREILESKNVIFLCVCGICNNLWTVCNHCSLRSHPEHQSTWDLQTPHWSGGLQRIHSGLNSLAAAQTPRPQRGSAGLSGLEKVELAAITTCSDCLANLLEIKEEQQRVAGPLIRLILLSLWLFVILNYLDVKPAPSSTRLTANIKTVLILLYCYAADAVQLKWNEMRGRDEVSFTDGEGGSHFYCK